MANRAFPGAQASHGNAPPPFEGGVPVSSAEESQPVVNGRDLAAPPVASQVAPPTSESAFRNGGGPPPLQMGSDVRGAAPRPPQTFAPMEVDSRDRSAAPGRPAPSLSGRSVAGEDEERHAAERTPVIAHLHGRREPSYRPGSSSGAGRQDEWSRDRPDRAISNYNPSPRVSPTASRTNASYAPRSHLDSRVETSPRSMRRSPAYDYGRHGSTGVDARHAQLSQHQSSDRLSARDIGDRTRGSSTSRYSESGYDAERIRMDERRRGELQEHSRARLEEDKPSSLTTGGHTRASEDAKKSSRAASPVRPMSSHSRPGSSRRKKKSVKATAAEKQQEREAELARQAEAEKAAHVKPASPPRSRVIDEGKSDRLLLDFC